MPMIAISIRQPWAWAILHPGKDIENRTWPLPTKHAGKQRLIHTGKQVDQDAVKLLRQRGYDVPDDLPTGGIVGAVTFSGSSTDSKSPWAEPGHNHWAVASAVPLPFHPCSGRLSFFEVDYPKQAAPLILEANYVG